MKLTTGILLTTMMMMTVAAFGQNPNLIQSTQDKLNAAEQQKVAKENEALGTPQSQSQTSAKPGAKPSPAGAKAAPKAAKPLIRVAPATKSPVTAAKPATPTSKPAGPPTRTVVVAAKPAAPETSPAASKEGAAAETPKAKKIITAEGRRDPFVSPVVSRATGPVCSVGKRCLAIDQILVRGVVKSETGMIAVVVNSMNKAYFLKEN